MYLFELCFFLDICPEAGLLDHMATLFLRLFHSWEFPGSPVVRSLHVHCWAWVESLAGELRP